MNTYQIDLNNIPLLFPNPTGVAISLGECFQFSSLGYIQIDLGASSTNSYLVGCEVAAIFTDGGTYASAARAISLSCFALSTGGQKTRPTNNGSLSYASGAGTITDSNVNRKTFNFTGDNLDSSFGLLCSNGLIIDQLSFETTDFGSTPAAPRINGTITLYFLTEKEYEGFYIKNYLTV